MMQFQVTHVLNMYSCTKSDQNFVQRGLMLQYKSNDMSVYILSSTSNTRDHQSEFKNSPRVWIPGWLITLSQLSRQGSQDDVDVILAYRFPSFYRPSSNIKCLNSNRLTVDFKMRWNLMAKLTPVDAVLLLTAAPLILDHPVQGRLPERRPLVMVEAKTPSKC